MDTSDRPTRSSRAPPPRWFIPLTAALAVAWAGGMFWLNNVYSGWSRLAAAHPAGERALSNSLGPTTVTVVAESGRHYVFESRRPSYRRPEAEVGYDEAGFWVRSRGTGWFAGPYAAVFVPWEDVYGCAQLRVQLRFPPMALIVHDQALLDACRQQVDSRS